MNPGNATPKPPQTQPMFFQNTAPGGFRDVNNEFAQIKIGQQAMSAIVSQTPRLKASSTMI